MDSYDEKALLARVNKGWKGGDLYSNLSAVTVPTRRFVDGWPAEVKAKLNAGTFPQPTPTAVWSNRR